MFVKRPYNKMKLGIQAGFNLVSEAGNLLDAFITDLLAKKVVHMAFHVSAKVAAWLILAKDNPVSIYKDFKRIALGDPEGPAELLRDHHTAQIVDTANNSGTFHCIFLSASIYWR